jgi:hypothetical protein
MALLTPVLEGCVPKSKRVATTSIMFDPEKFVIAEKLVLPDPPVANVVFVLLTYGKPKYSLSEILPPNGHFKDNRIDNVFSVLFATETERPVNEILVAVIAPFAIHVFPSKSAIVFIASDQFETGFATFAIVK